MDVHTQLLLAGWTYDAALDRYRKGSGPWCTRAAALAALQWERYQEARKKHVS